MRQAGIAAFPSPSQTLLDRCGKPRYNCRPDCSQSSATADGDRRRAQSGRNRSLLRAQPPRFLSHCSLPLCILALKYLFDFSDSLKTRNVSWRRRVRAFSRFSLTGPAASPQTPCPSLDLGTNQGVSSNLRPAVASPQENNPPRPNNYSQHSSRLRFSLSLLYSSSHRHRSVLPTKRSVTMAPRVIVVGGGCKFAIPQEHCDPALHCAVSSSHVKKPFR